MAPAKGEIETMRRDGNLVPLELWASCPKNRGRKTSQLSRVRARVRVNS
jgi:hypothetical protein